MTPLVLYFGSALVLSLLLTPMCRATAIRFGFTAKPKEDRWHQKPTALFGGIAIVVPTLALGSTLPLLEFWQLLACGAGIACLGLIDDSLTLKPSTKLIVQIALASALVFLGYRLHWTDSQVGDTMLTLFWIVGVTNAFNLLDNMDGLCAGTALVAGSFTLFGLTGDGVAGPAALYLAALLGATAGFLVYNFHPASIFMGDTGSLFLGLNLAAVTLISGAETPGQSGLASAVAAPVLLLLVPILDTTLVTAVRLLSGRRPSQGGRDHTSHRLVAIGLSQRMAVAVLWLLAAAGGTVAILIRGFDASWAGILSVGLLLASILFAVYLARIRIYEDAPFKRLREGHVTPLVADFMYKRRVLEVLLDLCLITLAYYTAYRLRFESGPLAENYPLFVKSLPIVVTAQLFALFVVGGYRGIWHQFGMMDAVVFAKGVFFGSVTAQLVILYAYRFRSYSRAVFVIYAVVVLLLLVCSRASFRLLGEFVHRRRVAGQRCVVYGTGSASLATIREAFGELPLRFVGFIDDDPQQRRLRLSGYSVLGDFDRLLAMMEKGELDCVVLNTRMIDVDRLNALEAACQHHGISLSDSITRAGPIATEICARPPTRPPFATTTPAPAPSESGSTHASVVGSATSATFHASPKSVSPVRPNTSHGLPIAASQPPRTRNVLPSPDDAPIMNSAPPCVNFRAGTRNHRRVVASLCVRRSTSMSQLDGALTCGVAIVSICRTCSVLSRADARYG